jgi:hypothetical protein
MSPPTMARKRSSVPSSSSSDSVIRISDVGRAEALSYDSFRWEPQDAEIRYFTIQFVLSR